MASIFPTIVREDSYLPGGGVITVWVNGYLLLLKPTYEISVLCISLYNWGERERAPSLVNSQAGGVTIYIYIYRTFVVPAYKLQYFICDTCGPTRNHGKNTT